MKLYSLKNTKSKTTKHIVNLLLNQNNEIYTGNIRNYIYPDHNAFKMYRVNDVCKPKEVYNLPNNINITKGWK
jgi:hypothetical protein